MDATQVEFSLIDLWSPEPNDSCRTLTQDIATCRFDSVTFTCLEYQIIGQPDEATTTKSRISVLKTTLVLVRADGGCSPRFVIVRTPSAVSATDRPPPPGFPNHPYDAELGVGSVSLASPRPGSPRILLFTKTAS